MSGRVPLDGAPQGVLYVTATPIGNLADMTERARAALSECAVVVCEDTRRTGKLLSTLGIAPHRLIALHAHNERARVDEVLALLSDAKSVCLVSDAGTPLVSDPGERLVEAAIAAGTQVIALPGASAVLAALVVSGLPAQPFRFEGFLPRKGAERAERLAAVAASPETSVLFEAPTRVRATLVELRNTCGGTRAIAVCRELTKLHEEIWRGTLEHAADGPAALAERGEYVLVVGSAPAAAAMPPGELEDALQRLAAAGLGRRSAVQAVEALLGVSHKVAYAAALEVSSFTAGSDNGGAPGTRAPRSAPGRAR